MRLIKDMNLEEIDFDEINQEYKDLAQGLIDSLKLDYGNGEIFVDVLKNVFDIILEAPNHATLQCSIPIKNLIDYKKDLETDRYNSRIILKEISNTLISFDADEEFNALWSTNFAEHNNFKPSQFIEMLQEDEIFFQEVSEIIIKELTLKKDIADSKYFDVSMDEPAPELER